MASELQIDLTVPVTRTRPPSIFRDPIFAVLLGIVLPILCLFFDPIIFRTDFDQPMLGECRALAYDYVFVSMLSLAVWIFTRRFPTVLCGVLYGGFACATLLGVVILPVSVIGLLFIIGIFGFSPFLTAAVFWSCARQAREVAGSHFKPALAVTALGLFFLLPLATRASLTHYTQASLTKLVEGSDETAAQTTRQLKLLWPLIDSDILVQRYVQTDSVASRLRIAQAYRELTGNDLDYSVTRQFD